MNATITSSSEKNQNFVFTLNYGSVSLKRIKSHKFDFLPCGEKKAKLTEKQVGVKHTSPVLRLNQLLIKEISTKKLEASLRTSEQVNRLPVHSTKHQANRRNAHNTMRPEMKTPEVNFGAGKRR